MSQPKNRAAQALAALSKGIPRKLSEAERARRRERLAELRKRRWPQGAAPGTQTIKTPTK